MEPQRRVMLCCVVMSLVSATAYGLPTGYRCGSELSLILCPNQTNYTSELGSIYNQKLIRGQILDPSIQCPTLGLTPNGLVESNPPVDGETGNSVTTPVAQFYLGGPCTSDDDCRQFEAYCLPFPEFLRSSRSNLAGAYFSKYITNAGLPPPTSYVCRCVPPRTARFSISERKWVCRSPEEITNAVRSFANTNDQDGRYI